MGIKRKLSEMESVHPSRQALVPDTTSKPRKKPRRLGSQLHKKPESLTSINAIKKRIRDAKRRLERSENLPANMKVETERALAAYQLELVAAEEEKTRQKMISKYHMVRFFERQKASRQVKKLRKRLLEAKATEEVEDIKAQMHIAEVDLNYTRYYPLNIRYVSLYPQKNNSAGKDDDLGAGTDAPKIKPPMWAQVEKCMNDDTLDQLRDGRKSKAEEAPRPQKLRSQRSEIELTPMRSSLKLQGNSTSGKYPKTSPKQSSKSTSQSDSRTTAEHESKAVALDGDADDESDGGFFEE